MKNIDFEDYLWQIKDMLRDKVADYLDVNRMHVDITYVSVFPVVENTWNELEEGEPDWFETYYHFFYRLRKSIHNADYGDEVEMIWQHNEVDGSVDDRVMTAADFERHFESHESGNPIWHSKFHADEEDEEQPQGAICVKASDYAS